MRRLILYSAILLVLGSCSLRKQDSPGNIMNVRLTIEAISGSEGPVLTNGAVGTEGNKYGFEGGTVIRLKDGYHLFTSEMAGDPRWVKMKLAHWLSADGVQWKRISTVRESSGDFTGKDHRAAIWSPMPFFNVERNLWVIHYIGYRARAGNPEGPWKRCSELNPVDLGISFTENPIVTKLDNGLFVAVVDAGYDSTGLKRSAFGYFYSNDGIHWSKEQLCYIENKVPKWWNQMRTPLCIIKEDDGTYTVFHTAYKKNDYGSIGKLKVKINTDSIKQLKYADNRPVCKQRMDATDIGVVLHYGNGPDSCDISGARDLWVYRANDSLFCMHYDAAGPRGWMYCTKPRGITV